MFDVKNSVFRNLTKRQKSMLCSSLRSFVKLHQNLSEADIFDKFVEEENYYYEIQNPHLYFVVENLEDDDFIRDLKRFINAVVFDIEYKKSQKPILDKQKEIAKEQRKRALEYKMKREKPSCKQLKYYKNLCKNHALEPDDIENASKYDLKIWISEIIDKYAK